MKTEPESRNVGSPIPMLRIISDQDYFACAGGLSGSSTFTSVER